MRQLLLCSAFLALTACGPKAPPSAPAPPAPSQTALAPAPAASPPRLYEPLSRTAMAFTGALEIADLDAGGGKSPGVKLIAGTGHVYEARFAARTQANSAVGDGPWTAFLPVPLATPIIVYKVTSESVNAKAANGGFCAPAATTYLGLAEYANAGNEREMQMAAFKGQAWPPADATALCGTFTYVAKAAH